MTQNSLKSVFTLDSESQTYKPAAHNLSAEQATERFSTEPSAKITEQGERHRNPDPAEELSAQHAQAAEGSEQSEDLVAQESESD